MKSYYCSDPKYVSFDDLDPSVALAFLIKDAKSFKSFIKRFRNSCSQESFLGIEIDIPCEDLNDFESVDDDDFELIDAK
jgi:Peptidase family C54